MTSALQACTGRRKSTAPSISAARARRTAAASSKWQSQSGRTPLLASPAFCRFRPTWTNFYSPAFCGAIPWNWSRAKRWIWKFRPTPRSSSKDTSNWARCGPKARSATTPDFIRSKASIPFFTCTCITHRKDPLYLTTIVGPPPQEDYFIGHAIERVFLPVMKMQYPEIVDVAMPAEGIFQNLMIVSIRKSYPGHARKIMNAIWSLGQAMFTKVVVVVDHDVNVQNSREVVWKALCAIDPERDIQFVLGPVDTLDHAARRQDFGSKMGIDATRKWAEEGFTGRWPDEIKMDRCHKKSRGRDLGAS